jgi:hypothetical protein
MQCKIQETHLLVEVKCLIAQVIKNVGKQNVYKKLTLENF